MKLRVRLMGRHAHRTPLAYPPYRDIAHRYFEFVESTQEADFLIFGFRADIIDHAIGQQKSEARTGDPTVVLVSEEPLWDTLWGGDYRSNRFIIERPSISVEVTYLNHVTSPIFEFARLPYFVTTSDDYFVRYRNLFFRNRTLNRAALRRHFESTALRTAFFCERRVDPKFIPQDQDRELFGLNVFRSQLAEAAGHLEPSLRVGKGWGAHEARQKLPDWHMDKLASLDRRVTFVSAIENTHQRDYITEKPFDAFAVLGVPLYVAGASHRIHEIVPRRAYLNLPTSSVDAAVLDIEAFTMSDDFLDSYGEAQGRLADLFSDPETLDCERERLVDALACEFARLF